MATAADINVSVKMTLNRLRIIHLALMAGMCILTIFVYKVQQNPQTSAPGSSSFYVYLVPLFALAGYFSGLFVFKWLISPLTSDLDLAVRLARYQSASLLQYTCVEIPALLALFAYLSEGHIFYVAIAGIVLLYFFALRPTHNKMLRKIPLSAEEKKVLG
jgi:hypothetical protein